MKKDYLPVADEWFSASEEDLVADFWSQRWDSVEHIPEASLVAKREEYKVIAPFLQQLTSGSKVLDGGCGLGEWTVFLGKSGFEPIGLDLSQSTIHRLRKLFPGQEFICGDIRKTSFQDDTFDAYLSWGTFEHFENGLGECIKEAYRILKPGGMLFASVPYQNWRHILRDSRPLRQWDRPYSSHKDKTVPLRFYQWRLTIPEFEHELSMWGFRCLKIQSIGQLQGLSRALVCDLKIPPGSLRDRVAKRLLPRIIPARWIAHMILAVAQKTTRSH